MYLYITLDTTGLCPITNEILSINVAVGRNATNISRKSMTSFKIKPTKEVTDDILKYNKISRNVLDTYSEGADAFDSFHNYLKMYSKDGEEKLTIVCYNSKFIYKFLSEFFNTYSFEPPKENRYSALFNYLNINCIDVVEILPYIELISGTDEYADKSLHCSGKASQNLILIGNDKSIDKVNIETHNVGSYKGYQLSQDLLDLIYDTPNKSKKISQKESLVRIGE